jgi:hypothetical protein
VPAGNKPKQPIKGMRVTAVRTVNQALEALS